MSETWSGAGLDLLLAGGTCRRADIENALREAISSGRLPGAAALPSSRALARDLGVARGTVVDAYGQLAAEGWVRTRPGGSTSVAPRTPPVTDTAAPSPEADRPLRHDLRAGRPDVSAFPRSAWVAALRRALRDAPDEALTYGDLHGRIELRRQLVAYLGRVRGVRTAPERIVLTSGFSGSLATLARALRAAGATTMALEDPCVGRHVLVVEGAGLKVRPLPVDGDGAPVERLDDEDAVLLTPSHHNPLGAPMPAGRRASVVEWARQTGGWVIEDDYDGEFRYDRQPVGALQGLDPTAVIYAGTTSKTLAPGLRLGWLALPAAVVDAVLDARAELDREAPALDQLALAELIRSGTYDRHVRRMRLRYRARRDRLLAVLAEHVPDARVTGISAGVHAVVELPARSPGENEVVAALAARSVAVYGLDDSRLVTPRPAALLVGYGTPAEHAYPAAVGALAEGLRAVLGRRRRRGVAGVNPV